MRRQIYNPFLPLDEYIPDGEPHVFGDRVYIYGSHDREGGYTFCMDDYTVYSAPIDDLTNWRKEGVTFKASQDPDYPKMPYMYAPDVVQGNDGKYYLYYCMSGDNGVIRVFYGTQYDFEEREDFTSDSKYVEDEMNMFGRTKEEILSYPDSIMGAVMVVLEDDMLTVKEEPRHIIPYKVKGTSFEEHPFFEASSMRKVNNKYYFVYSSMQNHELCYATSDYPDHDFVFGGTIVSNGDIGFEGRKPEEKHNMTGTTHGSIVEIDGQWYVLSCTYCLCNNKWPYASWL